MQKVLRFKEHLIITFQSLIFFLLAYFIVWFIHSLVTSIAAINLEMSVVWKLITIEFIIPQSAWDPDKVKITFSAGPLAGFLVSVIGLIIYMKAMHYNGILKLLFLWMFVHGWISLFGGLLIGTLTRTGLGFVTDWLYLQDTELLVITIAALSLIFSGGVIIARPSLLSANYYVNKLPVEGRFSFIFSQFVMPYLLGNLILFGIRITGPVENHLIVMTTLIMLLPIMMLRKNFPDMYFEDEPVVVKLEVKYAIILIVMLALFYLLFYNGIRLGF